MKPTHDPRWPFDCDRCKFDWNCGPTCSCHYGTRTDDDSTDDFRPNHAAPVGMKSTPPERREERIRLVTEMRARKSQAVVD